MSSKKMTQVGFTGKTSEYFGIWIVNLLLTILTLGIYSAWAKVRRKKYFHHNTLIDNVGFDYHAKPMTILKGRIIAFIFFIGYAFGGQLNVIIPAVCILLFFLALPWLVVWSSIFNARNTSHRGLRFDFVGKVGEAALVYILLPIVTLFSLYLALPYMEHQRNKFMMNSHRFGLSKFDLQTKVSSFYKVYAIVFIVPLIGILAAVVIPAYKDYSGRVAEEAAKRDASNTLSVPMSLGFVSEADSRPVLVENSVEQSNAELLDAVQTDMQALEGKVDVGELSDKIAEKKARMKALAAEFNDADVDAATVDSESVDSAEIEEQQRRLEELLGERVADEPADEDEQTPEGMLMDMMGTPIAALFFLLGTLAYLAFIFAFVAYFKSRLGNLIWNNTTLEAVTFKSSLRARDFLWIYFSNIIAIVLTFGLATPWAQIRLARYRASKLQIVGDVDFEQFVGEQKEAVKAIGEEAAEFFDVDFSFG